MSLDLGPRPWTFLLAERPPRRPFIVHRLDRDTSGLLVVAMLSQRVLRREADGRAVLHADLKGFAKFHANDMLVDPHGNAFIGCFGFDLDAFIAEHGTGALFADPGPPTAPIMRVTPDGKASIASPDHKFPNGMALVGNTFVVAECFIPGLTAFDLSPDGTLNNRRPWATLSKDPPAIVPDPGRASSLTKPSFETMTFSGFRSRWTMPFSCAAARPWVICSA